MERAEAAGRKTKGSMQPWPCIFGHHPPSPRASMSEMGQAGMEKGSKEMSNPDTLERRGRQGRSRRSRRTRDSRLMECPKGRAPGAEPSKTRAVSSWWGRPAPTKLGPEPFHAVSRLNSGCSIVHPNIAPTRRKSASTSAPPSTTTNPTSNVTTAGTQASS